MLDTGFSIIATAIPPGDCSTLYLKQNESTRHNTYSHLTEKQKKIEVNTYCGKSIFNHFIMQNLS